MRDHEVTTGMLLSKIGELVIAADIYRKQIAELEQIIEELRGNVETEKADKKSNG